jgi:hypothetical protein
MPRPQFTLRALLVAMLVVGAFFGGIWFERERQRREDFKNLFWDGGVEYWPPGPEFKLQRERAEKAWKEKHSEEDEKV